MRGRLPQLRFCQKLGTQTIKVQHTVSISVRILANSIENETYYLKDGDDERSESDGPK